MPKTKMVIRRRTKGRPLQNSGVGKEAILDATLDLLRHTRPGALTLKEVALQAGVDAALVRYYFGNKEGLLRETISLMLEQRQATSSALLRQDLTPKQRLHKRISAVLTQQCTDPNFHQLVVEQLFSSREESAKRMVETIAARGLAIERAVLQGGEGKLRAVDPRFLNICILGMCEFFASSQPLVAAMFKKPIDEKLTQSYIDFLVDLLLNGLRGEALSSTNSGRDSTSNATPL